MSFHKLTDRNLSLKISVMSLSYINSFENFINKNFMNFVMSDLIIDHAKKNYPDFPIHKGSISYDQLSGEWKFYNFSGEERKILMRIIRME